MNPLSPGSEAGYSRFLGNGKDAEFFPILAIFEVFKPEILTQTFHRQKGVMVQKSKMNIWYVAPLLNAMGVTGKDEQQVF